MVLNVHINHKAYCGSEKVGEWGVGWWVGRYTVTTRMTPALRRAAMIAHFNVSLIVRNKVAIKTVSTDHNF